ncbi:MAG: YggS family pyridoxal phosphate-dependent enzyme [Actinomycetes bacterium]
MVHDARTAELADRLAAVRDRIQRAAEHAGRRADEVTLVVVTKMFPADDVRRLAGLGVADVGENRDQEAASKAIACADLGLCWHFLGQLQTNKARSVVRYADLVHSVDRPALVAALSAAATRAGRVLGCLVQVDLDTVETHAGRGGVLPRDVTGLAELVAGAPGLRLAGVMGVAPLGADPEPAFELLAACSGRVLADHPQAQVVSAGMSADLEAAVLHGATHVRVGTAVLGSRPSLG